MSIIKSNLDYYIYNDDSYQGGLKNILCSVTCVTGVSINTTIYKCKKCQLVFSPYQLGLCLYYCEVSVDFFFLNVSGASPHERF